MRVRAGCLFTAGLLTAVGCAGDGGGPAAQGAPASPAPSRASQASKAPAAEQRPALRWSSCPAPNPQEGAPARPPGNDWECATLRAPLDYAHPDRGTLDIAMIRARATDPAHRIGSLVFNFGGPGGSGVATLPAFADDYRDLRKRYDLVSFDPRGVGRSAGVTCLDDKELDAYYAAGATPRTAEEQKALIGRVEQYARGCEKHSGNVLPHVGTADAARDMDLMRQALGDDKLHYFGVSYGTELGGVYAHLFPRRVGRAVFDAVVDPTADPEEGALGQARGFELALGNYLTACAATHDNCPTEQQIVALLDRLGKNPVPGGDGRMLTQSLATTGIAQSLYSKDFWDYLTEGLEDAENGDGKILMALGDAMNGRGQDGRYSTLQASLTAISCADYAQRYTAAEVADKVPAFRRVSPVFGDFMAWSLTQCTGWPVKGAWQRPDVGAKGAAPVLVVGNTGDPATPYEGARRMARALGDGVGIEMTYRGQGHGAYDSGNPCVKRAVDGYLLDGTVPGRGTVCS
ncbi:peptidase [Streptomyces caatingaensis]|uniref:Peptidase n=1 Tax=Streptomyces caatingaensis TaxID=1678637 RepID=A0A0K9XF39_9ACTN|nr:peptidase [Streptomyces caatingaensis]